EERRKLVERYRSYLSKVPGLVIPFERASGRSSYHIMPVLLPADCDRTMVMQAMRSAGVQTSIHFPPVDKFTAYREAGLGPCEYLRYTHEIGKRALTLPLYPSMGSDRVDDVCEALVTALRVAQDAQD